MLDYLYFNVFSFEQPAVLQQHGRQDLTQGMSNNSLALAGMMMEMMVCLLHFRGGLRILQRDCWAVRVGKGVGGQLTSTPKLKKKGSKSMESNRKKIQSVGVGVEGLWGFRVGESWGWSDPPMLILLRNLKKIHVSASSVLKTICQCF